MPDYTINTFYGLNTAIKDTKTLKAGFAPASLNWLTGKYNDHIELRRGYARLGVTEQTGTGKVTGMGVSRRYDGTEVLHYSHGRKVKYYDTVTDDAIEVGTNLLPAAADGEDIWMEPYQNLAGSMLLIGSSNSGIYKIPAANPGSAVDQSVNNYRFGVFSIGQNRAFAGQRNGTTAGNKDRTGLYVSYIDKATLSAYTQVTGEAFGTGDGVTKTFADTLADITGVRTAMYVSVTDTVETFVDDRNGNMVGNLGGTGTVNYATGAVSVTFNTAPANLQAITCSYYYEASTTTGILDFSTAFGNGQAKLYRQDDGGGDFMSIYSINNIQYCFHLLKTWQLTISLNDTESTNLPYRNVGIPYSRAAWQTPEGVIMADLSRPNEPKFRRLQVLQGTNSVTIEPLPISDALDLTAYGFDYCVAYRWGDYEIFCVQEKTNSVVNTYNSRMFVRNVVSGAWDELDYYASILREYNGTLVAGDSVSNNVYTLFSGYDEDGGVITNYWTSSDLNLGTENIKKCRKMVIDGLIQTSQRVRVSISYDGGPFSEVYTIEGDGDYVDSGINTYIGGPTIGSKVLGGGGSTTAHPFEVEFLLGGGKFITARIKVEALDVGFIQINAFTYKDIRDKGRKNLPVRMV